MFLNRLTKVCPTLPIVEGTLISFDVLENSLNNNIELIAFHQLRDMEVYKYNKFENAESDNLDAEIFEYVIGIKTTPTNLLYHATHMNGNIITSNTQNKILSELRGFKINSNAMTGLHHLLLALINETKNKIAESSPIILHLHDFKDHNVFQILHTLSEYYNIRAVVLTHTNPHNGCRPPKIKTKQSLVFHHAIPRKIYKQEILQANREV
jgi:hypothetical protein